MPVVFVTNQDPTKDYSVVEVLGSVTFVTRGRSHPNYQNALLKDISNVLVHSKPDDFLLFSGETFESVLCLAVMLKLHGRARVVTFYKLSWELHTIVMDDLGARIEETIDFVTRRG